LGRGGGVGPGGDQARMTPVIVWFVWEVKGLVSPVTEVRR
jgi:hypothetical protein